MGTSKFLYEALFNDISSILLRPHRLDSLLRDVSVSSSGLDRPTCGVGASDIIRWVRWNERGGIPSLISRGCDELKADNSALDIVNASTSDQCQVDIRQVGVVASSKSNLSECSMLDEMAKVKCARLVGDVSDQSLKENMSHLSGGSSMPKTYFKFEWHQ